MALLDNLGGWGSVIGTGIKAIGAYKGNRAQQKATEKAIQAADPKSVFGMLSQAYYDPATKSYKFGLSPEAQQLMGQQFADIQAHRAQREKLMGDPEAVALRRARETIEALEPSREDRYGKTLSNLYGKGLATSSIGSQAMADLASKERLEDIATLQASRGEVQSDIDNLLNREIGARKGMLSLDSLPQDLAKIGINVGENTARAIKPITAGGRTQGEYMSNLLGNLGTRAQGLFTPAKNDYDALQAQDEELYKQWLT